MLASERSCAAEPDRPVPLQVADHDAVGVSLADRDLVDADRRRRRHPCSSELLLHVLLVEFLDRPPIQGQLAGDVLDRRGPTAPAHEEGKALGVEGVVREPRQLLLLHFAATPAAHPTALGLQIDSVSPAERSRTWRNCDRRFDARADRTLHTKFFSPPLKPYDAHLGIAEHTSYCRPRTKSGELIHIHQPPRSSHRQFMPSFPSLEKKFRTTLCQQTSNSLSIENSSTRFAEEPIGYFRTVPVVPQRPRSLDGRPTSGRRQPKDAVLVLVTYS